jgi:drug/metabolite transporter (DMT)-like permease
VAISVGYLAFDETLTASQLAGVALTSFVVMLLPARAPTLVEPQPVPSAA